MNKKPVSYLQIDSRWKNKPYRVPGEKSTIGSAGCGPTCAAMAIETLTGKTCTPVDTCAWSIAHGYKAKNQGTYYGYFAPQFAAYGIGCKQLLGSRILNKPAHPIHDQVKQYLADGYYVIALMGPGTWTKGGHFVLLWAWDDKVRINDPASTKNARLNGYPDTFKKQVRNYWLIDAREYNKEDDDMTEAQVKQIARAVVAQMMELDSYPMFVQNMERYRNEIGQLPPPSWAEKDLTEAITMHVTDGSRPQDLCTRAEAAAMAIRAAVK